MNKTELINIIAERSNLPKVTVDVFLSTFIDTVTKTVKKGDSLTLAGFGTFSLRKRAARTGCNPATGETIKIPAKKSLHFKASPALNKAL